MPVFFKTKNMPIFPSWILCLLLLTIPARVSGAQVSDISFDNLSINQGLSQSIVKCILQDRRGMMIFGTEDGLNFFNGYSFAVFRKQPGNINSLSYNDITAVCQDRNGNLWIGTFNSGVNLYQPERKRFRRFSYQQQSPNSLSNGTVNAIAEDGLGTIWIATDDGLNRIVPGGGPEPSYTVHQGIQTPDRKQALESGMYFSLFVDYTNTIWAGTERGLVRITPDPKAPVFTFKRFTPNPVNPGSISNDMVRVLFQDSRKDLWIGTDQGLNRIDKSSLGSEDPVFVSGLSDQARSPGLHRIQVSALCEDLSGKLWIGTTGGGIILLDPDTGRTTDYTHDPLDLRSLSSNEIRSLYCDRSGIIWIGTYGRGVDRVARSPGQILHYKYRAGTLDSLSHPIVWSFYEARENILWVGTQNGLNRLNRKTNSYRYYRHQPGLNSLSHQVVRVITPSRSGKLLIGTNGGGVDIFDPATGRFENLAHDPRNSNSLSYNEIRDIYQDREGIIWIGTYGRGMDRYDPVRKTFTHHRHGSPHSGRSREDAGHISSDYIRFIREDRKGNFWIGTEGGGLNRFDRKSGRFHHYRMDPGDPRSINSDYIFSMLEDSRGFLWLGTYGGGLNRFDPRTGRCRHYSTAEGLPSSSVYGILQDQEGFLWISTTNGISRFDPKAGTFKNFNIKDGLQDNEFNGGAFFKSKSGEMFFGGINGFNAFFPGRIQNNTYIPPVVITSFKKFNQEVPVKGRLSSLRDLKLSHSENMFTFEFSALDYTAPEKNRYAYIMEGLDSNWIFTDATRRYATYTTLPPGDYTFRVIATNSDGLWNREGVTIRVTITPPLWKRTWFVMLTAALMLFLAMIVYRRRLKNIRMKAELKTAHQAQMSIMPQKDPRLDFLEVSGICLPAYEVGGDFFDYFWIDRERRKFGILIGDVSGKAMKAAVTAIMASGMINTEVKNRKEISNMLESVNHLLLQKIEKQMFVAVCICQIDAPNRTLTVVNAGLSRPILKKDGGWFFLNTRGSRVPLGVRATAGYEETVFRISPGSTLVLTTDGVSEAMNSRREMFTMDRLKNYLETLDTEGSTAAQIKNAIIREITRFSGKYRIEDDMTVLVVKFK